MKFSVYGLAQIAQDLSVLENDDEKLAEEWTKEEKSLAEAEADVIAFEDKVTVYRLDAYITFSGRCGFASAGSNAYVVNRRRDRATLATVRVRWSQGGNSGQYDRVKRIPAGGRVPVGCTRGFGVGAPTYSYSVVGTQPA
ncbi:MAG: hypothetical protein AAF583_09785 [Pseudomonadota bacterium]